MANDQIMSCILCITEHDIYAPQYSVRGAAGLKRDAVSDLIADVDVHLIGHTEGQLHRALLVNLSAHYHAILILRRQAKLCTPLRDLNED